LPLFFSRAFKSIQNVISVIKEYWSCFQFDKKLPAAEFFKKQKKTKPALDANGVNASPSRVYTLRNRTLTKSSGFFLRYLAREKGI
jgi:hypothetical protein